LEATPFAHVGSAALEPFSTLYLIRDLTTLPEWLNNKKKGFM
jgi:hypothetical protein